MSKLKNRIRVGITMGDPSGVGPAIISKTMHRLKKLADFVVIGDKWVFSRLPVTSDQLPVKRFIDLNNVPHKNFAFGKIKAGYGKASTEYLDRAIELIKNNEIDCLVTCPVSKEAVNLGGLNGFSGQTEYIAQLTDTKHFVMMLLNRKLKFSLVTRHIALKNVSRQLDREKIYQTILLTHRSLKKLFLIKKPHIVVCGLNPHGSDNGLMGNEENKIIKPVVHSLRRIGRIDGPLPCDTAILKAVQKEYDCVIAMYHDQALIPLKISDKNTGVNITLGFRFIRTSPLHGTAFNIAKTFDLVNPLSFIEAIKLVVRCTQNQRKA